MQQWLLQEKEKQAVQDEIPVQAAEDEIPIQAAEDENPPGANIEKEMASEVVVTAKTDEAPAAEESTEAPEEAESEEQEIVEEKPEIKVLITFLWLGGLLSIEKVFMPLLHVNTILYLLFVFQVQCMFVHAFQRKWIIYMRVYI